jgi:chitinase
MIKALAVMLLILTLFAGAALAADVQLAWDANDPAPTGYAVFVRPIAGAYDYNDMAYDVGPALTVTIPALTEGQTYAFVARAYVEYTDATGNPARNWSGDSNEIVYTPTEAPQQIVIPQRINGIRIIFE